METIGPFRRTVRPFKNHHYWDGGQSRYILHPKFVEDPRHYIRAFLLLQKDLQELFDYIEPDDNNQNTYSYRIHALLLRTCVEVEANCKAILKDNGYLGRSQNGRMDMTDYKKINVTHRLSSYYVKVPDWNGSQNIRYPFQKWANREPLPWYEAYNAAKHDRRAAFKEAKFEHLIDACCALFVILSAQFGRNDFLPGGSLVINEGPELNDDMDDGIGGYFRIRFPDDFPEDLLYSFNWQEIQHLPDPFQMIDYRQIE